VFDLSLSYQKLTIASKSVRIIWIVRPKLCRLNLSAAFLFCLAKGLGRTTQTLKLVSVERPKLATMFIINVEFGVGFRVSETCMRAMGGERRAESGERKMDNIIQI
jgi:hypothetical protein